MGGRLTPGDKDARTVAEALAEAEQRLINIPGNNIRLLHHLLLPWHLGVIGPLLNLLDFINKKNTFSLSSRSGLHNPGSIWVFLELLTENGIVSRQDISHRDNVHVEEAAALVFFSNGIIFFFHIFFKPFDVLNHQVFTSQLQMIRKMVQ